MAKKYMKSAAQGLKKMVRIVFSNKKSTAGVIIMLFFVLMAAVGPVLFKYNPVTD